MVRESFSMRMNSVAIIHQLHQIQEAFDLAVTCFASSDSVSPADHSEASQGNSSSWSAACS